MPIFFRGTREQVPPWEGLKSVSEKIELVVIPGLFNGLYWSDMYIESKKGAKDQETIQSSTTPDPGEEKI